MIKLFTLTGCVVLASFYLHAQSVKNGGFETGDTSGWKFETPATYGAREAGYVCHVVKDTVTNQNFVLQLTSIQNNQWCQLKQSVAYKPTDSIERLQVSASVRLQHTGKGTAGIMMRTFGNGKDYGIKGIDLDKDTGWATLSFDALVTRQIDSLVLFCTSTTTGRTFFDNITIKKITLGQLSHTTEAKNYLDSAINIISRHALYKDSIDFAAVVQQALLMTADAKKTSDCYPAIQYVLSSLEDHHSFFLAPEQAAYINRSEDTTMAFPTGKKVNGKIGYLKLPACDALNAKMEKTYSNKLQQLIRSIDSKEIIGWIIDDRDNTGGNVLPMLSGLGSFFENGVLNKLSVNGRATDSMVYRNGTITNKDTTLIKTESPYRLIKSTPKVAVLMNGMSGSSGEVVIVSFKHRPRTRFFGEASYGLSTANSDFTLSDGSMIFVCSGKQADQLGNEYGGKIYPDEIITNLPDTNKDEVTDAAMKWLSSK